MKAIRGRNIEVGDTFKTKTGDAIVVKYENSRNITIRMIDTGTIIVVHTSNLKKGEVKDRMAPLIFGVGFIGIGSHKAKHNGSAPLAYGRWSAMLNRCYSKSLMFKNYWDCTVCDEWHNYQVFAEWFDANYPLDGKIYDLDKDYIVAGNRVYSPETCCFLTRADNMAASMGKISKVSSRDFLVTNPQGVTFNVTNLKRFCEERGINYKVLHATSTGAKKQCKGWVAQRLS